MHNFFGGNLPGMLLLAFSLNLDISCKTCYEKEFLVQVFFLSYNCFAFYELVSSQQIIEQVIVHNFMMSKHTQQKWGKHRFAKQKLPLMYPGMLKGQLCKHTQSILSIDFVATILQQAVGVFCTTYAAWNILILLLVTLILNSVIGTVDLNTLSAFCFCRFTHSPETKI